MDNFTQTVSNFETTKKNDEYSRKTKERGEKVNGKKQNQRHSVCTWLFVCVETCFSFFLIFNDHGGKGKQTKAKPNPGNQNSGKIYK